MGPSDEWTWIWRSLRTSCPESPFASWSCTCWSSPIFWVLVQIDRSASLCIYSPNSECTATLTCSESPALWASSQSVPSKFAAADLYVIPSSLHRPTATTQHWSLGGCAISPQESSWLVPHPETQRDWVHSIGRFSWPAIGPGSPSSWPTCIPNITAQSSVVWAIGHLFGRPT